MSLGEKVKEKRENRGMTQKQLAQASGISQATISRLESGRVKELKSQALRRLADALGVTMDYLVDKPDTPGPNYVIMSGSPPQLIFRVYEKLSPDRKRQFRDFARFLLQQQLEERVGEELQDWFRLPREQAAYEARKDSIPGWSVSAPTQKAVDRARDLLREFECFRQHHEADETMSDPVQEFLRFLEHGEADETIPGGCTCSPETHLGNDPSRPG